MKERDQWHLISLEIGDNYGIRRDGGVMETGYKQVITCVPPNKLTTKTDGKEQGENCRGRWSPDYLFDVAVEVIKSAYSHPNHPRP